MSEKKFPAIPDGDSRKELLEDLEYGGMYGYANARGAYDRYPSTLEFEDAVLRDIMKRATSITYAEANEQHAAELAAFRQIALDAYKLADSLFERCQTIELLPKEYEARLDELCVKLVDMGIEVE